MRVKEEFKESGDFWLPSASDKGVHGTLLISDGGNIELEVDTGKLENSSGIFNVDLKRIIGYIHKDRTIPSTPVTLDDCYYKILPDPVVPSKSLIRVGRVFIGHQYAEDEIPRFNTFTFSVEGIDDWIQISGIKVEEKDEKRTPTILYDWPSDFSLKLENDLELRITWKYSLKYKFNREAGISEKRYFQLYSTEACELDKFISVAHRITEFLCFAINKTVCLDSMSANSDNLTKDIGNDRTQPKSIKIYYQSWPYSKDEPKIGQYDMLFKFLDIQNDAEKKINNWLKSYGKFADAFRLYFLAKAGTQTYLEEKFLTLVQGLEAYHQIIQPNRMELKIRLEKIIKPFENLIVTNQTLSVLIDSIKDTRNYETHHDLSLKPKAAKGRDLWILCLKMEVLFELHFLKLTGFNEEEIKSIVKKCSDFKYKLLSS